MENYITKNMCGIVAAFEFKDSEKIRIQVLEMSKKIRHRGPDWTGIYSSKKAILAHERLSIVDPESGKQPLYSKNKELILAANGEIYNHNEIKSSLKNDYQFSTRSDCEVILALYQEKGCDFLNELNGISLLCFMIKKGFLFNSQRSSWNNSSLYIWVGIVIKFFL